SADPRGRTYHSAVELRVQVDLIHDAESTSECRAGGHARWNPACFSDQCPRLARQFARAFETALRNAIGEQYLRPPFSRVVIHPATFFDQRFRVLERQPDPAPQKSRRAP